MRRRGDDIVLFTVACQYVVCFESYSGLTTCVRLQRRAIGFICCRLSRPANKKKENGASRPQRSVDRPRRRPTDGRLPMFATLAAQHVRRAAARQHRALHGRGAGSAVATALATRQSVMCGAPAPLSGRRRGFHKYLNPLRYIHIFNPLLFAFSHIMPKLITPFYNTFGIPGLLALPWVRLRCDWTPGESETQSSVSSQPPAEACPTAAPFSSLCRPQQVTLTLEKVSYDTLAAARGYDLEAEHEAKVAAAGGTLHGGFPSGGAALPNCSLIPVRGEQDRLILSWLGDRPRGEPVPTPAEGQEPARGT